MLRVKEILEIPGFLETFNRIEEILKNYVKGPDNNWELYRSSWLQSEIKEYLRGNIYNFLEDIKYPTNISKFVCALLSLSVVNIKSNHNDIKSI